jgi:pSer/pThr/pTyr-binding forkhead associated (FHA) protein
MEVKLVVASGKKAGFEVPVKKNKFFIGRADDCQLRIQSESVGRHHCVILLQGESVAVRDFGTKGGTLVNGENVKGEWELKQGDRLKVGKYEFEVQLGAGAQEETELEAESAQAVGAETVESSEQTDLDLDSWLRDPETSDTETAEEVGPEPSDKERRKKDPSKVVGVWEKGDWNPTSVDPRSAAADALKGFFGRPR